MRKRTRARELALQTIYQFELRDNTFDDEAQTFLQSQNQDPEINDFIQDLIRGYLAHQSEIDQAIKKIALNWDITRMAIIDRIILRLGVYELMFRPDVPPAVAINEAVDLAKKYGDKDSGAFVNGILDKIHHSQPERKE